MVNIVKTIKCTINLSRYCAHDVQTDPLVVGQKYAEKMRFSLKKDFSVRDDVVKKIATSSGSCFKD